MKVMVTSGDRHVHVYIKGSDPRKLRKAEKAARRLLAETVAPAKPEKPRLGFAPAATEE